MSLPARRPHDAPASSPLSVVTSAPTPRALPRDIEAALWRGDQIGAPLGATMPSGFAALDAELPGGGWPCNALTELLQPQPGVAEWRLLGDAVRRAVAAGRTLVVVAPPHAPHLPGLQHLGVDERHLVWVRADRPAERLWVTEQLIRANAAGLLLSWLPQARPEQIRRLQLCAQSCDAPVFLCRPVTAASEPSAAPLRVELRFGADWELQLRLLKRKGPTHEGVLTLASVPGGLESILTPRLRQPSRLIAARQARDTLHVVGSPAPRRTAARAAVRSLAAH